MPDPSAPLISVPLPTIPGRERYLEQAVQAYERYANVELLIHTGRETCGEVWAEGAAKATGDYIHFGADDVEMREGWWQAAAAVCDRGLLPAPLVLYANGNVQACGGSWERMEPDGARTEFTRGPFVSRAQWNILKAEVAPFLERAHYYTDNIFSVIGRRHGIETVNCHGYSYTHHLAATGRQQRDGSDGHAYNVYVESLPQL